LISKPAQTGVRTESANCWLRVYQGIAVVAVDDALAVDDAIGEGVDFTPPSPAALT
jgi:hypothetical protein